MERIIERTKDGRVDDAVVERGDGMDDGRWLLLLQSSIVEGSVIDASDYPDYSSPGGVNEQ